VQAALETCLPKARAERFASTRARLEIAGLDAALARQAATLPFLITASDAALAAHRAAPTQPDPVRASRVAFAIDEALALDWLRERLASANVGSRWERLALSGFEDQLGSVLRRLTQVALLRGIGASDSVVGEDVSAFLQTEVRGTARFKDMAEEITAAETCDIAMLAAIMRVLESLAPPS
jgi:NAD-specific glutamate dehydrogenase